MALVSLSQKSSKFCVGNRFDGKGPWFRRYRVCDVPVAVIKCVSAEILWSDLMYYVTWESCIAGIKYCTNTQLWVWPMPTPNMVLDDKVTSLEESAGDVVIVYMMVIYAND